MEKHLSPDVIEDAWFFKFGQDETDFATEEVSQLDTKGWWDRENRTLEDMKTWKSVDVARKPSVIGQARMAAGHPAAAFAHYGDSSDQDTMDMTTLTTHSLAPAERKRREVFRKELAIGGR